jgi:hypothetical protein
MHKNAPMTLKRTAGSQRVIVAKRPASKVAGSAQPKDGIAELPVNLVGTVDPPPKKQKTGPYATEASGSATDAKETTAEAIVK